MSKHGKNAVHRYRLDNSGIIHMAAYRKGLSNSFRFSVTLHEAVDAELLQQAFDAAARRFPTLVAGIRPGFFCYYAVPVEKAPPVQPDDAPLRFMERSRIRSCAMRVLWKDRRIAVEFFHSITDGYGGITFLQALTAEYLKLAHGVVPESDWDVPTTDTPSSPEETEDSFAVHSAPSGGAPLNTGRSYQLLETPVSDARIRTVNARLDAAAFLAAARARRLSVTELLTVWMMLAIMDVQKTHRRAGRALQAVQIMVSANLRNLFPSRTLRNFSLYAVPRITPEETEIPFEELSDRITAQLHRQFEKDALRAMMTTNQLLDRQLRFLPLPLKFAALWLGFRIVGERNTTLTFSNMGRLTLPAAIASHVERVDLLMTPRICSAYNCAAVSYDGRLQISFCRRGEEPVLERSLLRRIAALGLPMEIEADGRLLAPAEASEFLQTP